MPERIAGQRLADAGQRRGPGPRDGGFEPLDVGAGNDLAGHDEGRCPLQVELQGQLAGVGDLLGDRWTLMILYLAFQRVRRFDEFQAQIGLARKWGVK